MFEGRKCLVVGSGVSGQGAVSLLGRMGAEIVLFDGGDGIALEELEGRVPSGVRARCFVLSLIHI